MVHPARLCAVALLCATAALAAPNAAAACSCVTGIPICQTFWRTPAVFSALALEVRPESGAVADRLPNRVVRLQVEQSWRGGVSGIIEAQIGTGGGDCGSHFTPGVRYLVFADHRDGGLFVSICNRTRPLSDAADDLAYLAKAFQPAAVGRIYGTVQYQRTGADQPERPISGYTVMLHATGQEWKTATNAAGGYEFRVPAGKYGIRVDVPATEHAYGGREVELIDPRGCASQNFYVVADGRIATRVVDPQGKPVPGVMVEFVTHETLSDARQSFARRETSGPDGRVEARQLQPDRYVIGLNVNRPPEPKQPYDRVFYPGVADAASARVVDLQPGERIELDAFVLPPPLAERRFSGVVRWPDGSPAAGASVGLRRARGARHAGMHVGNLVTTDGEGRFTIAAPGAQRYEAWAFVNVKSQTGSVAQWSAGSAAFDADADGGPMTLVLAPPRR